MKSRALETEITAVSALLFVFLCTEYWTPPLIKYRYRKSSKSFENSSEREKEEPMEYIVLDLEWNQPVSKWRMVTSPVRLSSHLFSQDAYGRASNVTCDGAIAVLMDAITGKAKKKAAAK